MPVALELEKIALSDDYFVSRKLYPNVDFYSGLIYEALQIPVDMFPVLFAIPRTSGWLAQWEEMLLDKEQKIARPRQIYTGYDERRFVPMSDRRSARVAPAGRQQAQGRDRLKSEALARDPRPVFRYSRAERVLSAGPGDTRKA